MLQIIVWMLCVYLVLKAVELYLIASGSARQERRYLNLGIALFAGLFAVVAAFIFFMAANAQVEEMPITPSSLASPY